MAVIGDEAAVVAAAPGDEAAVVVDAPGDDVFDGDVLKADEAGADEEKYDPVGVVDVVEAGLEGKGVDGGDESTT